MKILITGMAGFVGSHLAELAAGKRAEVHGTRVPGAGRDNLEGIRGLRVHDLDIRDAHGVNRLLGRLRPDRLFHLAGQSNIFASTGIPEETLSVNVLGSFHILEACRKHSPKTRVLIVGSANEYGHVEADELPILETHPLRPSNPYAVSKVCQDLLGQYFHQAARLPVICVRPFNHIGPRQSPAFVCSDFARQIARIEHGLQRPVMEVGNLDVRRDFTDVRDIVRAYWLALEKGKAGETYNLGSGRAVSVRALLQGLLDRSSARITVQARSRKVRKQENAALVGDYGKFRRRTGWKPVIPFGQTLQDTLDYWREQTAREARRSARRARRMSATPPRRTT